MVLYNFVVTFDSAVEIFPLATQRNLSYSERGDKLVPRAYSLASGPGQSLGEKSWNRGCLRQEEIVTAYLEALILRLRPDMFQSSIQGIFAFPAGKDDYVNDEKNNQRRQHPE